MKPFGTLIAASMLIAGTSAAWAANVTGMIKSIDVENHEIVLEDGKSYAIASNVTLEGLKPGDKIKINSESKNGKNMVDKVEQISSAAMNGTATTAAGGGMRGSMSAPSSGTAGGVSGSLNDTAAPNAKTPTD